MDEIDGTCSVHECVIKTYIYLSRNLKKRSHVEGIGVEKIIILKWKFQKWGVSSSGSGKGSVADFCEHSTKLSDFY